MNNLGEMLAEVPFNERLEIEENLFRKDFTEEEKFEIQERLRKLIAKKQAKGAAPRGNQNATSEKQSTQKKASIDSRAEKDSRTSDAQVGQLFDESRGSVQKRRDIVEAARAEPRKHGNLLKELNAGAKVGGLHKRLKVAQQTEQIQKEPPPLPKGPFRVIVADPPWHYEKRESDTTHRSALPYPSMSIDEIKALRIGGLAHDDAILWLWTTNAHLPEAFGIVKAWGFEYKTMLTWAKDRMGVGDWLRGQTEHCLMCVRGKPTVNLTNQTTILHGAVRKHSQKPEEFYSMAEKLCPGSKVELFSRSKREGWIAHGNEI